jgi:OMF family outer membrane factor
VATAKLSEEDTRQSISLEVTQALLNITESQERLRTTAKDVEQAREALRLAGVRYKAGVSTAIEVTDAEVALTQVLSNRVSALYDYQLALASYRRALGRPIRGE